MCVCVFVGARARVFVYAYGRARACVRPRVRGRPCVCPYVPLFYLYYSSCKHADYNAHHPFTHLRPTPPTIFSQEMIKNDCSELN